MQKLPEIYEYELTSQGEKREEYLKHGTTSRDLERSVLGYVDSQDSVFLLGEDKNFGISDMRKMIAHLERAGLIRRVQASTESIIANISFGGLREDIRLYSQLAKQLATRGHIEADDEVKLANLARSLRLRLERAGWRYEVTDDCPATEFTEAYEATVKSLKEASTPNEMIIAVDRAFQIVHAGGGSEIDSLYSFEHCYPSDSAANADVKRVLRVLNTLHSG